MKKYQREGEIMGCFPSPIYQPCMLSQSQNSHTPHLVGAKSHCLQDLNIYQIYFSPKANPLPSLTWSIAVAAYSGHIPVPPLHPFQTGLSKVRLIMGMTLLHKSLPFLSTVCRWWYKLGDSAFRVLLSLPLPISAGFCLIICHGTIYLIYHGPRAS